MSLAHTTAVQPRSISAEAAAWPPSRVYRECWISSSTSSAVRFNCSCIVAWKPSILRSTGTKRFGPTARPIRVWPSDTRCVTASRMAARSSGEMNGACTLEEKPLTRTKGTPWARSCS